MTLILCEAGITFDMVGKFNVIDVELAESTVRLNAKNVIYTVPGADKEKNASLGLTADIINLSPVVMGVGAKKSKLNSVVVPTVNCETAVTPAIVLTVTGLTTHVVLSISE